VSKTSLEQFEDWVSGREHISLEFKEAKNNFDSKNDLPDYCAALANEGGGKLILGVNDNGKVVGTKAFHGRVNKLSHEIFTKIKIRVDVEEFLHSGHRILIFHVPGRLRGQRIKSTGNYLYPMRMGDSLAEMDDMKTKEILNENQPDFTSEIVANLSSDDLDLTALEALRKKWADESNRDDYLSFDHKKILKNSGLEDDGGITFAGLILVGKPEAIRRHLPDAEIIFEWRHDPKQTHYDFRKNWRAPFINIDDEIWEVINARNLRIPFQQGFFQREVWAFDEKSIREAVHNAVMHRDYSIKGRSIFIKASPQEFFIESPGGFPPGITLENILHKKEWRNRLLAEAFERIGFAERSSQGLDDIFEKSIREGKGLPDLSKSNVDTVCLKIPAQVKDEDFILYLERVTDERQINLSFEEIYELEMIREKQKVDNIEFKNKFLQLGIIEQIGKTRGARYILSHKYYIQKGKSGIYTRLRGLSREHKKELILQHLKKNKKGYARDFKQAFDELSSVDISNLLRELKNEGKILHHGSRKYGYWQLK
jgi:ATP-dependent DNA helicase RecG